MLLRRRWFLSGWAGLWSEIEEEVRCTCECQDETSIGITIGVEGKDGREGKESGESSGETSFGKWSSMCAKLIQSKHLGSV